jgi:hypothetical protein
MLAGTAGNAGMTAKVTVKPRYKRILGETKRAPKNVIVIIIDEMRVKGQK